MRKRLIARMSIESPSTAGVSRSEWRTPGSQNGDFNSRTVSLIRPYQLGTSAATDSGFPTAPLKAASRSRQVGLADRQLAYSLPCCSEDGVADSRSHRRHTG